MDAQRIIDKYYTKGSDLYRIYVVHANLVTRKALSIAEMAASLKPDIQFIREAAMLHDIGIIKTDAPGIQCYGSEPYIRHGVMGREMLDNEGLIRHALVCERHTGVGITKDEIVKHGLPLPHRDMVPISVEEKIICLADKFYSKHPDSLKHEKSFDEMRDELRKFGEHKVKMLDEMLRMFGLI